MTMVILGLGSNVGAREEFLERAVAALGAHVQNLKSSSLYESPALLPKDAPPNWDMAFLNMAVSGETELKPEALLAICKQIETDLGRQARGHWGPREIDIDILAFGNLTQNTAALTLPHPELLKRDFALLPLAEIAPEWKHPGMNKTAKELVQKLGMQNSTLKKVS